MRYLLAVVLMVMAAACRADEPAASEIGVAELLKLANDPYAYKIDAYLDAARSLQALGKDKACALLNELAEKELADKHGWPFLRTVTLCRMLFRAKPKDTFYSAGIGAWLFVGKRDSDDWPLEPIVIVDGIPFLVACGAVLGGMPELPTSYVQYCVKDCDWNDLKFKAKTKDEKRKALDSLLSSPQLKGKLEDGDKEFLEAQIK
jgi:hypothetical protein